jgi:hypothetical protein
MDQGQNYQNHAHYVPAFHFVAFPLLVINFVWAAFQLRYGFTGASVMGVLLAIALVVLAFTLRSMVTRVQDRVIRLEMRLRLKEILPAAMHGEIMRLTPGQLVALRFASDTEMPALCREVLEGKLASRKEIKMKVQNWQGDYLRA